MEKVTEPNLTPQVDRERQGSLYPHDQEMSRRLNEAATKSNLPVSDIMESFPVYARRVNLTRFLAHYELYKMIADLPGSIVECGVYRGNTLLTWAKLLEIFHPGDRLRKVIGFDNFAGFQSFHEKDGAAEPSRSKVLGGWNSAPYYQELVEHINLFHEDSFIPRAKRIELVHGDLCQTSLQYAKDNPGLRLSLIHLDVDLYEPTLASLQAFYPLLVPGGLVVLDQYGMTEWAGESGALDDYFQGKPPKVHKLGFASTPGGYLIKQ